MVQKRLLITVLLLEQNNLITFKERVQYTGTTRNKL